MLAEDPVVDFILRTPFWTDDRIKMEPPWCFAFPAAIRTKYLASLHPWLVYGLQRHQAEISRGLLTQDWCFCLSCRIFYYFAISRDDLTEISRSQAAPSLQYCLKT
jgi:hypothetical protein